MVPFICNKFVEKNEINTKEKAVKVALYLQYVINVITLLRANL